MLGLNGGLLGSIKNPSAGDAGGLWDLNEQVLYNREGDWPGTGGFRYWRFANFANTALNSNTFDLTEIELYSGLTKLTGITATANFSWASGSSSTLTNGVISASDRAFKSNWSSIQPTAHLTFDLGTVYSISSLEIFSLYGQPRFPASFDLQVSADNVSFAFFAAVTVGTSFTDLGGNVYTSGLVSV